jgi:hypothetical protein
MIEFWPARNAVPAIATLMNQSLWPDELPDLSEPLGLNQPATFAIPLFSIGPLEREILGTLAFWLIHLDEKSRMR